jgi:hypothetical protein
MLVSVTVPVVGATVNVSFVARPWATRVSPSAPPLIVTEPVAPRFWYSIGSKELTATLPASMADPGVCTTTSAAAVPTTVSVSFPASPS